MRRQVLNVYRFVCTLRIQICPTFYTFYWSHLFLWWKSFDSLSWFEGKAQFLVCDVIVVEFFCCRFVVASSISIATDKNFSAMIWDSIVLILMQAASDICRI